MRLLLTGAAGSIGAEVGPRLREAGHDPVGLDLRTRPDELAAAYPDWVTGDCLDPDVVGAAVHGVDAVVHLAGIPHEAGLAESLTSHVASTQVLLDAMLDHGVRRIAYASSNHAVGLTPRADLGGAALGTDVRPRPDTHYGVAKVAAEALLSLYVDRYDVEAVAMRIGSFLPAPTTRRALSTWLSPDDAARMVEAAVTAKDVGFAVLYGISANTDGWWDLGPGEVLGYHPLDDADDHRGTFADREDDAAEATYVGGPYAWGHSR